MALHRRAQRATPKSETSYIEEEADAALVVDAKPRKRMQKNAIITQRIAIKTQNNALKTPKICNDSPGAIGRPLR
ncbi:MAG: hypothetical protein K8T25_24875 [Planctomycetia bacterium]|nr:hypothetical protein [Planctomycetia bacterium]